MSYQQLPVTSIVCSNLSRHQYRNVNICYKVCIPAHYTNWCIILCHANSNNTHISIYLDLLKEPEKNRNTLWLFNIAMENGPFIEDLWWFTYQKYSNMVIFQFATLNHQTVFQACWEDPCGRSRVMGPFQATSQPDFYTSAEINPNSDRWKLPPNVWWNFQTFRIGFKNQHTIIDRGFPLHYGETTTFRIGFNVFFTGNLNIAVERSTALV